MVLAFWSLQTSCLSLLEAAELELSPEEGNVARIRSSSLPGRGCFLSEGLEVGGIWFSRNEYGNWLKLIRGSVWRTMGNKGAQVRWI